MLIAERGRVVWVPMEVLKVLNLGLKVTGSRVEAKRAAETLRRPQAYVQRLSRL